MIIESLMISIFNLFTSFFDNITIDNFLNLEGVIDFITMLIDNGIDIFQYFIPPFGQIVITVMLSIELFFDIYLVIMWLIKKIPMLNIH